MKCTLPSNPPETGSDDTRYDTHGDGKIQMTTHASNIHEPRVVSMMAVVAGLIVLLVSSSQASAGPNENLALNETYTASSIWEFPFSADKAFDGNLSTRWVSKESTNEWVEVDFGEKVIFDKVVIKEGTVNPDRWLKDFFLQYYNGEVWIDVEGTRVTGAPVNDQAPATTTFIFPAITAEELRLRVVTSEGPASVWEFEVFNTDKADNQTFAASSQLNANLAPAKAFDDDLSTKWVPASVDNEWVSIDFGQLRTFDKVMLVEGSLDNVNGESGDRWLEDYRLQYHNGTTWVDIPDTTVTDAPRIEDAPATVAIAFDAITADKVRLYIDQSAGRAYLWEFGVYGENQALAGTFSASSEDSAGTPKEDAFDANTTTNWAAATSANEWLAVDFGSDVVFDQVLVKEGTLNGVGGQSASRWLEDYRLQYHNGTSWVDIPGTTVTDAPQITEAPATHRFTFAPVYTDQLRLHVDASQGLPWVWELQAYNRCDPGGGIIQQFDFPNALSAEAINSTDHTILVTVQHDLDISDVAPTITLASGATISPRSGQARDFSEIVKYTTNCAGETIDWHVTVEREIDADVEDLIFDVFDFLPASPTPFDSGTTAYTNLFTEATQWSEYSPWNLEPLTVFQAELSHDDTEDTKDWSMRIGKGGQVYSIRTAAGEILPPQHRDDSQWNDEVIQLVALNTDIDNRDFEETKSHIHQAGTYDRDSQYLDHSWYSRLLREQYDATDRSHSSLVWAPLAHVRNLHRSNVLFYTKYKDLGDGVIQADAVIYNGTNVKQNRFNVPFANFRDSVLPYGILSLSNGSTMEAVKGDFGSGHVFTQLPWSDLGGWYALTESALQTSNGIAVVFGEKETGVTQWADPEVRMFWYVDTDPAGRDLHIATATIKTDILPGDAFYFRYFYVIGMRVDIEARVDDLIDEATYGPLQITKATADVLPLNYSLRQIGGSQQVVLQFTNAANAHLGTYAQPVDGSYPLHLMRDTSTGDLVITRDPYQLAGTSIWADDPADPNRSLHIPHDGGAQYLGIWGYAMPESLVSSDPDYEDLTDTVTDTTYYPDGDAETLWVRTNESF